MKCEKVFGHIRVENKLTSTIFVEDLNRDLDLYALSIAINTDLLNFISVDTTIDENDRRRIAYRQCRDEDLCEHFGDCTGFAMSCSRCIAEDEYREVLQYIEETKPYNLSPISILSVVLSTEHPIPGLYNQLSQINTSVPGVKS